MTEPHDHSHQHNDDHAHGDVTELHRLGLEAFSVPIAISAPAQVLPRVETVLPPGWRKREPTDADHGFILRARSHGDFRVEDETGSVSGSSDLQVALEVLDARLRACIALHAPEHVFVHAGVVGRADRAIVLPGPSFSGKTTLVAELVRRGATYYSDEFAVLDGEGLVHPYPKPLSMRLDGPSQTDRDLAEFGGVAGEVPLPIGLIAITQYVRGSRWDPQPLSAGQSVLSMLENTVPAQERPEQALATISRAVDSAVVLRGERGEAAETAGDLLASVAGSRRYVDH
jgi:hypothetical protein